MGKMMFFQDAENAELEEQALRNEKLKAHKPLFQIAMEYGCRFSHQHKHSFGDTHRASNMIFALGGGTIDCLALDLYLGEEDTINKDIAFIVEELKEHPRLEFTGDGEYLEMGWKSWNFKLKGGKAIGYSLPLLKVRAWFESSKKCRKVGTGKFEEVMEVVCDD